MSMKNLYPMRLSALPMERLWGGDKLGKIYNKNCGSGTGETWELSVREKEKSVVSNGILAGKTLSEIVDTDKSLVGERFAGGEFPLLIKFIDAADDLSVQVHPDDEYAAKVENDVGKTEMWHIVEAEPGAKLVYGLADGVTPQDFVLAVREGKTQSALKYVEVHAGETYFIPAGLVHAIGGGILLAEVQQNCDLTYRVYDFDRLDKNGKPRELHTEKALCFPRIPRPMPLSIWKPPLLNLSPMKKVLPPRKRSRRLSPRPPSPRLTPKSRRLWRSVRKPLSHG